MDISGFLLASGFALLIVLLGWSSQIASKGKETRELEAKFLRKANLKSEDYKKIIHQSGSPKDSLFALVDFLFSTKTEPEDIEIFEKVKLIKSDLVTLDTKYTFRFWTLLAWTACLFISGFIVLLLPSHVHIFVLFPNLIFLIALFSNLIKVYTLEKRYIQNISRAMEKL